jgi:small subunit ribosomal protein S20
MADGLGVIEAGGLALTDGLPQGPARWALTVEGPKAIDRAKQRPDLRFRAHLHLNIGVVQPVCGPALPRRERAGRSHWDTKTSKDIKVMANTSSAKKAARQMITRTARNKSRRTRLKSSVRGVEEAISSGDKAAAAAALKAVEPILARTAQKGIVHKKTASRKVSRLAARVKSMA